MAKKYCVELSASEREYLIGLTEKRRIDREVFERARILLKADQSPGGPARLDRQLTEAFDVSVRTIERLRQRFVGEGPDHALRPPVKPRTPRKIDGAVQARIVALACSDPPPGFARWSLHRLAARIVELEIVESISHEQVRQVLKKTTAAKLTGAVGFRGVADRPEDRGGSGCVVGGCPAGDRGPL